MYMYIHVLYIRHVSNGASLAVHVCLIRLLLYTLHRDDPVHMVYRTPHIHLNGDGEVIIIHVYIYQWRRKMNFSRGALITEGKLV